MARFKKGGKKEVPQVSTSSLPDIVYMLIFFFMITTSMRQLEPKVRTSLPKASEVVKLEKKTLVSSIYIGPSVTAKSANELGVSIIQLNDDEVTLSSDLTKNQNAIDDAIVKFITSEREARSEEDRKQLTTALKVDRNTGMGVVTDVKQALRKVGAYRINYTTLVGNALEN